MMAHARHLATEYNRVALTAAAFSVGDMDAVGRLMLHSRRFVHRIRPHLRQVSSCEMGGALAQTAYVKSEMATF